MHCLGSGGIRQTWQNLAEMVDCGRIWQRRQIAANCGGTCGRLWWRQVEGRWRVCKVSRRCPVTAKDKEKSKGKLYKNCKDLNAYHDLKNCFVINKKTLTQMEKKNR